MTLTNQLHVLRRLLLGGLLTTGMASAFVMMSSGTANAGWGAGSGGGGGTGSGTICHAGVWRATASYNGFVNRTTAGCGWSTAGAVKGQFKSVAKSCYSHSSSIVAIFYLSRKGSTAWLPGNLAAGFSAGWIKDNITRLTNAGNFGKYNAYKSYIKSLARGKVKSKTVTVVCVWAGQLPDLIPKTKCPKKDSGPIRKYIYKSRSQKLLPESLRKLSSGTTNNTKRGNWCATKPPTKNKYTLTEVRSSAGKKEDKSNNGYNIVSAHPYAWNVNFDWGTKNITGDSAKDWQNNTKSTKYTAWSDLISHIGLNYGGYNKKIDAPPPSAAKIATALNKDKATDHGSIKLSAHNKEVLARGGVANAVERTSYYGINERRTKTFTCDYIWTTYYNFRMNQSGSVLNGPHEDHKTNTKSRCNTSALPSSITNSNKNKNKYGNWTGGDTDVKIRNDIYMGTPEVTALRQAFNVHCNKEGYEDATKFGSKTNEINVGDAVHNWSGAATTNGTYKGNAVSQNILWGKAGTETGEIGLYDKECAFNGVIKDGKKETTTSHFRNNDLSKGKTEVDLFVPVKESVVSPKSNEKAVSTTVTRWSDGTPYAKGNPKAASKESGGIFTMSSKEESDENSEFFSNSDSKPAGQKNFTVTPYSTTTSGLVPEQVNKFYVAATWASQKHAPQVLTFKYEYAPDVSTVIPTSAKFDSNSNISFANESVSVPIHGKIYAKPGSTTSPAVDSSNNLNMFKTQHDNTGSVMNKSNYPSTVANNADKELPFGGKIKNGKWTVNNPRTVSPYYRVLKFVRATTE